MTEPIEKPEQQSSQSARMSRFGFKKPRIFPPVWLLLCVSAMFALDRWLPLIQFYPRLSGWPSWLMVAPGLALILIAANGFKRAKTGVVPFSKSTALVTDGVYRYTRNPMYLGMALILAGIATKLGSLSAWLPVISFVFIIQRQFIRNEEIFLTAIYSDDYREFIQKVRRWL
ncbi:MAG: isoprenylcysteine carboxylmethyltransferase family protein [Xanthomonadales bacterium]|nr:isoprenylcysteine carboxylmethyltransferase family protein [Xanthomonadales bacterium]